MCCRAVPAAAKRPFVYLAVAACMGPICTVSLVLALAWAPCALLAGVGVLVSCGVARLAKTVVGWALGAA